jgi:glycosyltransferase involved in cell wall biosynthesis/SAM-dependent methyltransferase
MTEDTQHRDRADAGMASTADEARVLAELYDETYFKEYGRGPFSYQTQAPYRPGEQVWENYFGLIADMIVAELAPATVLDAGCSFGFLVRALRERGVEAWGLDISGYAISHVPESIRPFCRTGSITDRLDHGYDLIVSTEVFEHLPPHLAATAVENVADHTDSVLFSASADGFGEPTHLNVQPPAYWVELFGRYGFFRNLNIDPSVISPQAIHFLRAQQTAATVASAYERRHWQMLAELSELRAGRHAASEAIVRAQTLQDEVDRLSERAARLFGRLEETGVERAEVEAEHASRLTGLSSELAALRASRTFRYTAPLRRLYAIARRARAKAPMAASRGRGPLRFGVDEPSKKHLIDKDGLVAVRGWVFDPTSPVARLRVRVNDCEGEAARLGLPRPDVAAALDAPSAAMAGFEALIDLAEVVPDEQRLTIELTAETLAGGTHTLNPVHVRLSRPENGNDGPPQQEWVPAPSANASVRLLVFTHDLGLGGGQLYLFELLRHLAQDGEFAITLTAPADGSLRDEIEALGVPVHLTGAHPVVDIREYEARRDELAAWARDQGFNAVLANTLGTFPGVDVARSLSVPAVWAIHESFPLHQFWRAGYGSVDAVHPAVRARAADAFASAAAVVFEANATRELFVHLGEQERFLTVPYGIDLSEIDRYRAAVSREEARRRLRLPEEATVLLCLGTIEPRKGQARLVEAFVSIARDHPGSLLVLVGARPDALSAALRHYIEVSGLSDRCRVEPITPDIFQWYRSADALVSASDVESLPRTVLEAMAFSLPVVATSIFGLPELITDGENGYLYEPRDLRKLVGALNRLLDAPLDERRRVGAAASALVQERHASSGYAAEYRRLLLDLVGGRHRAGKR